MQLLQQFSYQLIVVTNQSGIGRGYFSEQQFHHFSELLDAQLALYHIYLTATYFCPHHPVDALPSYRRDCTCRKPAPGMLLQASKEHQIDLSQSWMIGDRLSDVQAGKRAGCRTILLSPDPPSLNEIDQSDWIVDNLLHAAQKIVESENTK